MNIREQKIQEILYRISDIGMGGNYKLRVNAKTYLSSKEISKEIKLGNIKKVKSMFLHALEALRTEIDEDIVISKKMLNKL